MNSNFTDKNAQRFLNLAFQLANDKKINVADRFWLHGYLDATSPSKGLEPGFPAAPVGDARDRNNLRRTNWFNGRYLTAEALSRQDVYFDHRSRLNAHALMPGIAWGLGVEAKKGLDEFTLRRGLAFDGVGRPILVSQDFPFTLEKLIGVSLKTPRRVVGGGREFTPCVCLAPDPGGPSGGSAPLPSGPYLLVIEAGELPEGKAKVTGDVCGGRRSAPCEADVWQGSFGLSLVRFPVDVPLLNDIPDVWALRGTLSAYYFDVFEHPLWKRWDPDFPVDGSFRRDSGPGRHEGIAIPLALVHLGEDSTALYLDSWIPRRLITATPGEDWHRVRFGAPPRAAAWARIHQFQAMLQESLAVRPMAGTAAAEANLHGRGFRHIPPIGFLPVVPQQPQENTSTADARLEGFKLEEPGLRGQLLGEALRQAEAYFTGTNVITYGVVALHDDDILEDLNNVFDKDPLHVKDRERDVDSGEESDIAEGKYKYNWLAGLLQWLRSNRLGLDCLVNRHTEVVKLVVPLRGISRGYPLLGSIKEDVVAQASQWGLGGRADGDTAILAGLLRQQGVDQLPRQFVVYVKQRMVVLDVVFRILEVFQAAAEMLSPFRPKPDTAIVYPRYNTQKYHAAFRGLRIEDQSMLRSALAQPVVQSVLQRALAATTPTLFRTGRPQVFLDQFESAVKEVSSTISNLNERQTIALAQVADAWAAEYPEAQLFQFLAAVQPPQQFLGFVEKLKSTAPSATGPTVADGLELKPPTSFASNTDWVLYAGARQGLEERPIKDLVLDLPEGSRLPDTALVASLTVADVLARSPEDAAKVLGGADQLAAVTKAFLNDRQAALEASSSLADGVPAAVVAKVEAEVAAGQKPEAVLEKLKKEEEAKPLEERDNTLMRNLSNAETLLRVSGNRLDVLRPLRRQPGG